MILILGAGLAGLSCSYHLEHDQCLILEKNIHPFGQIGAEKRDGFTWDPGPHVSFTPNEYVKQLFSESVSGQFEEYEVKSGNYFKGNWIDHPAQTSLYQIPEPLRTKCLEDFLLKRKTFSDSDDNFVPTTYAEWLDFAFGSTFSETFPFAYTKKYWTLSPEFLSTDWVGKRVFYPSVDDVVSGAKAPLNKQTYYIKSIRYPKHGGYQSFANKLIDGANIRFGAEVISIDLKQKIVKTAAGEAFHYTKLVNTLPLPVFINLCLDVPDDIRSTALSLSCSQLVLINVTAPHLAKRPENWIYVYDEDKLSTRIHFTEKLTANNAPENCTGMQVEVYFSRHRPLQIAPDKIGAKVIDELLEMGLIDSDELLKGNVKYHQRYCPWANVIFDHNTKPALEHIWTYLNQHGLIREDDDCQPMTNWRDETNVKLKSASLVMAGRYGQWKYFWTDDCVLRGRNIMNSGFLQQID